MRVCSQVCRWTSTKRVCSRIKRWRIWLVEALAFHKQEMCTELWNETCGWLQEVPVWLRVDISLSQGCRAFTTFTSIHCFSHINFFNWYYRSMIPKNIDIYIRVVEYIINRYPRGGGNTGFSLDKIRSWINLNDKLYQNPWYVSIVIQMLWISLFGHYSR